MLLKEHLVRTFSSLTNATHQRNQAPMTLVVKEGGEELLDLRVIFVKTE